MINPKKPQEVDFTYSDKETKITEMEHLIADTIARRNYELEEIQNKNYATLEKAESWLNPQETSNKSEKIREAEYINQKLKHINLDDTNQQVQIKNQKNVSWSDEQNNMSLVIDELPNDSKPNLFNKLKKKPQQTSISIKNDFVDDNLQPIITPVVPPQSNIVQNQIPNIIKSDLQIQVNNMNKKIEDLQEKMEMMFGYIEKIYHHLNVDVDENTNIDEQSAI
jgi:hypothetical protein